MEQWGVSTTDGVLVAVVPVVAYWVYAAMYTALGSLECMQKRRLHPKNEEDEKNIPTRSQVVRGVLIQQALQIAVILLGYYVKGEEFRATRRPRSWPVTCAQILVGMAILDSWEYATHRSYHAFPFLYRHIHTAHHAVVVPYPYGALYNTPLEGFLSETLGGTIAFLVTGMTPRASVFLFALATVKTVDDHSGLWLPHANPFHFLFENNVACHDLHHQLRGFKYNFSTPFFLAWDKILGTYMPYEVVPRHAGGFEVRPKLNPKKIQD